MSNITRDLYNRIVKTEMDNYNTCKILGLDREKLSKLVYNDVTEATENVDEDKFYYFPVSDEFLWTYWNADAVSGDQFVQVHVPFWCLFDAVKESLMHESVVSPTFIFDYIQSSRFVKIDLFDVGEFGYDNAKRLFYEEEPFSTGLTSHTVACLCMSVFQQLYIFK